jgi:hypothetical protein
MQSARLTRDHAHFRARRSRAQPLDSTAQHACGVPTDQCAPSARGWRPPGWSRTSSCARAPAEPTRGCAAACEHDTEPSALHCPATALAPVLQDGLGCERAGWVLALRRSTSQWPHRFRRRASLSLVGPSLAWRDELMRSRSSGLRRAAKSWSLSSPLLDGSSSSSELSLAGVRDRPPRRFPVSLLTGVGLPRPAAARSARACASCSSPLADSDRLGFPASKALASCALTWSSADGMPEDIILASSAGTAELSVIRFGPFSITF